MPQAVVDPSVFPISSPWSGGADLHRIVFDDVFGSDIPANTRSAAMAIPAVARARNLVVSTVSRLPLHSYVGASALDDEHQPSWLYRTDTSTSPQHRLAWTIDDLIFYGWSCWWRTNGADGFPVAAERINQGSWSINADNRVEVNGSPVDDSNVILIPGLHEGILSYGKDTIADTRELYRVVRDRIMNPVPSLDLHQTDGDDLTDPEIDKLTARWTQARSKRGGAAVGYTNKSIEVRELGATTGGEQLLIEARNAASLDLARLVGIAAGRIDATSPKASLNYETTTGRNQEFVDFDLALYLTPVAARLSLDDCVPRGQRVAFDLTDLTGLAPSPSGPVTQD